MHELHELKDMLCEELEEYGKKELTAGSLDVIDKLTHTIKNLDKIIEKHEEEEYSGRYYPMYEGSYNYRGGSYADNRGRGSNARRDTMGRYASRGYSRDAEMIAELRELMNEAPDDKTRMEFQKFISKIENM